LTAAMILSGSAIQHPGCGALECCRTNAIQDAAGRVSMMAKCRRSARTAAGARMSWSSLAGLARSCALSSLSIATTAGISGQTIRDMLVRCIKKRFDALRAPLPVQWLTNNGSIFATHKTIEIALALNLAPCFTPVESPESNGMAEAFVKTFKRDYVRISLIPN